MIELEVPMIPLFAATECIECGKRAKEFRELSEQKRLEGDMMWCEVFSKIAEANQRGYDILFHCPKVEPLPWLTS